MDSFWQYLSANSPVSSGIVGLLKAGFAPWLIGLFVKFIALLIRRRQISRGGQIQSLKEALEKPDAGISRHPAERTAVSRPPNVRKNEKYFDESFREYCQDAGMGENTAVAR